jgi:hypothetical protein
MLSLFESFYDRFKYELPNTKNPAEAGFFYSI